MINTLDDYIRHSLPAHGNFETNPNLTSKVAKDGSLLSYKGNTVVFLLNDEVKERLKAVQDSLYSQAGDMLAEKLQPDTFHMTLHDLINGKPDQANLDERMKVAEKHSAEIISLWKGRPDIRMEATCLFNMVNTSIVLGLRPADAASWHTLDEMYMELEKVVHLGYGLSPHITMAYFLPGCHDQSLMQRLSSAMIEVKMDLCLSAKDLALQNFTDMNNYRSVL